MPSLFEPTVINGMALRNRFVRSATAEGLATARWRRDRSAGNDASRVGRRRSRPGHHRLRVL